MYERMCPGSEPMYTNNVYTTGRCYCTTTCTIHRARLSRKSCLQRSKVQLFVSDSGQTQKLTSADIPFAGFRTLGATRNSPRRWWVRHALRARSLRPRVIRFLIMIYTLIKACPGLPPKPFAAAFWHAGMCMTILNPCSRCQMLPCKCHWRSWARNISFVRFKIFEMCQSDKLESRTSGGRHKRCFVPVPWNWYSPSPPLMRVASAHLRIHVPRFHISWSWYTWVESHVAHLATNKKQQVWRQELQVQPCHWWSPWPCWCSGLLFFWDVICAYHICIYVYIYIYI